MSQDYQLKRVIDKIKELKNEQERLMHVLVRNRREERYELDRVRRDYTTRINAITHRQESIEKELRDKHRELERIERIIADEEKRAQEEKEEEEREEQQKRRRH